MLTVKEALELELGEELKAFLSQQPLDYILGLDQNDKLYVIPPTQHNLEAIKGELNEFRNFS